MIDSDDDSHSSSQADRSYDYASDLDDLVFDDLFQLDDAEPDGNWTYVAHSSRGGEIYEGLSKRIVSSDDFKLEYNYADQILLPMAKTEVKHSLSAIRQKLNLTDDTKIDPVAAFAGAMPEAFILKLFEWLKAGQDATQNNAAQHELVSFVDLIEIRCDIVLRVYGAYASELATYGITHEQLKRYKRVHKAMKAADMPAAKRHAQKVKRSKKNDPTFAGPAAETFDPIMEEVVKAINLEWAKNFFVPGESWIDIDDDKLNNCSPKFQAYGLKRTYFNSQ